MLTVAETLIKLPAEHGRARVRTPLGHTLFACYVPELLRTNADILASLSNHLGTEAELLRAIEMSRSHGALAWELRAATRLARLWATQGCFDKARDLLKPVYDRFTEGFATADLRAARQLLSELG